MTQIYDLHCHSDQSDGILSPEALVSRAKCQEVTVLALTDHDTTAGLARAKRQADIDGIRLITGIEFSSQWHGRSVHIVGLNVDPNCDEMRVAIERQEASRDQRAKMIAERLQALGIEGALDGARQEAGEGVIGRPHFAAFLVASGVCKTVQQAFKKYLGAGKPGDVKQLWPDMAFINQVIRDSGGIAVLAHPDKYNMTRTKVCAMVESFKASGGRAIEVVSGLQTDDVTRKLANIAKHYDLLGSCGSDFHVPDLGWQELGRFSSFPEDVTPVWHDW